MCRQFPKGLNGNLCKLSTSHGLALNGEVKNVAGSHAVPVAIADCDTLLSRYDVPQISPVEVEHQDSSPRYQRASPRSILSMRRATFMGSLWKTSPTPFHVRFFKTFSMR